MSDERPLSSTVSSGVVMKACLRCNVVIEALPVFTLSRIALPELLGLRRLHVGGAVLWLLLAAMSGTAA